MIVGNEPNLNLFWQPQFDPDGGDAAAARRTSSCSRDLRRAEAGRLRTSTVVGGALAPRGGDDPNASRQTHSPTQFILDLGAAYRASGRDRPLMDMFSIHVYGESPAHPADVRATRTRPRSGSPTTPSSSQLLGRAFDGTAQPGSKLPIVYGEYGVETTIPPAQAAAYTGTRSITPVDPATQARYYAEAIGLAGVPADRRGAPTSSTCSTSSGSRACRAASCYADGTPKPSARGGSPS